MHDIHFRPLGFLTDLLVVGRRHEFYRPDVPGYADKLVGAERLLLSIRPGITGPATLKYRDEEEILAAQDDPEAYNRDVIYPDKVKINLEYIRRWSLTSDMKYIWRTVAG